MIRKNYGHMCCCSCHKVITIHENGICDCGGPIKPPCNPCRPPLKYPCPPPEHKCQHGTIDIPQPPPFHSPGTTAPPDRPSPEDPGEIPWFRGQINNIHRNGPTFGPRKDEYLPYLLMRSSPGDSGARPFNGVFWESPDIFVAPDQEASTAPLMPPTSAGIAKAGTSNTLYAHLWNLGKAPAYRVRVEFYWFNPTLGISRADANLIGAAWVDLANRFTLNPDWSERDGPSGKYVTRGCHAIVRCPETWVPIFENGGHECLVVRAFEPILDPLAFDRFSPQIDRHVGQRNIAVVQASSPAAIDLNLSLGFSEEAPVDAEVDVAVEGPDSMEWLKLLTGKIDPGLKPPSNQVISGLLPPTVAGSRILTFQEAYSKCQDKILRPVERFQKGCDRLQIAFHAGIKDIGPKQAQVLRIRQKVDGSVIGGYSVVLIGK
jgi:hypothetical protein